MVKEFFEEVWNGIKRAVKFVVDVLLFIPRLIIKGVKCAIAWLEEDDDEQQVELVEKKVEEKEVNVPSSNTTSESKKVVPFAAAGVALGAAAAAAEPAKKETPPATEPVDTGKEAEKPLAKEETTEPSEKGEAEVHVETPPATEPVDTGKEAEKPLAKEETIEPSEKGEAEVHVETPVETMESAAAEVEKDMDDDKSSKTKKSTAKKASTKVEKVSAEIVDTKTGEVIVPVEVFGSSDKKASQYENAFIRYYNDAAKKYGKSLWMDGAIELQKFARSFLDALAIKESVAPLKGATADKRYSDLLAKLDTKVKFSENEKKKLVVCLGCQNCMGTEAVKPQMDAAFKLIDMYQSHYYEAWYKASQQGNPAVAM